MRAVLFAAFRPRAEFRPTQASAPSSSMRIRWLGTAGHVIEGNGVTLLVDPFLTRPSLWATATRALVPTPDAWWSYLPPKIDAILVGHSHYDHLLDAPAIAKRSGAKIIGSRSTAAFARAEGVAEEQIITVPANGMSTSVGSAQIRFLPSLHGKLALGRVPFPGEAETFPSLPARLWNYRMGGAFGVHVTIDGVSAYHNGSANLVDAELEGLSADVLLVGLAGRRGTARYLDRLANLLTPKLVIPTHHDAFFAPLGAGPRLLPGIDLDGFFRDIRSASPSAKLITPTYDDVVHVPRDDVRDAVVVPR